MSCLSRYLLLPIIALLPSVLRCPICTIRPELLALEILADTYRRSASPAWQVEPVWRRKRRLMTGNGGAMVELPTYVEASAL